MPSKTPKEKPEAKEPATQYKSPHLLMLAFGGFMLALILYGLLAR